MYFFAKVFTSKIKQFKTEEPLLAVFFYSFIGNQQCIFAINFALLVAA
jgi:hypothetical protein